MIFVVFFKVKNFGGCFELRDVKLIIDMLDVVESGLVVVFVGG